MRIRYIVVIGLLGLMVMAGCKKKEANCPSPGYPVTPAIQLNSVSYIQDSFVYYGRQDTFVISFTDGDADLVASNGDDTNTCNILAFTYPPQNSADSCMILNPTRNLFVVDSRDSTMTSFEINSTVGSALTATAYTTCGYSGTIVFPIDIFDRHCSAGGQEPCTPDTVQYKIFVRDRAGHFSNIVQTPQIIITPTL